MESQEVTTETIMTVPIEKKIQDRTARVGVIGLGYVGLPLLASFHRAGFPVTGFDVDPSKIAALGAGRSYIDAVPEKSVADMVSSGRFRATSNMDELSKVDAIIICVPTPLTRTREPDLTFVCKVSESVAKCLREGQLVVLESTTYPGTTEEVVLPILEKSGLKAGDDFFLAFSPEREDPGNRKYSTRTIPKLVGGIEKRSGDIAAALYRGAIDTVIQVTHARIAEAAKILENVYRCVNIALVNELKVLFDRMGIDVWEVINAAATKPFGYAAFYPGPGLGGHCIPIDPFYLTWKAREYGLTTRFIELAGEINTAMPEFVVSKVVTALNGVRKTVRGSRGLVVGLAYKKNTDDVRESPAFAVLDQLHALGAELVCHDPFVPEFPRGHHGKAEARCVPLDPQTIASCDYTLIITDHDSVDWDMLVRHSSVVIDTRNATAKVREGREKIVKA